MAVLLTILLMATACCIGMTHLFLYRIGKILKEEGHDVGYWTMGNFVFRHLQRFRALPPEVQARAGHSYRNFVLTSILGVLLLILSFVLLFYRIGVFQAMAP